MATDMGASGRRYGTRGSKSGSEQTVSEPAANIVSYEVTVNELGTGRQPQTCEDALKLLKEFFMAYASADVVAMISRMTVCSLVRHDDSVWKCSLHVHAHNAVLRQSIAQAMEEFKGVDTGRTLIFRPVPGLPLLCQAQIRQHRYLSAPWLQHCLNFKFKNKLFKEVTAVKDASIDGDERRPTSYIMTYVPLEGREGGQLPMQAVGIPIRDMMVRKAAALRASSDSRKRARAESEATLAEYPEIGHYYFINTHASASCVCTPQVLRCQQQLPPLDAWGLQGAAISAQERPAMVHQGGVDDWPAAVKARPTVRRGRKPQMSLNRLNRHSSTNVRVSASHGGGASCKRQRTLTVECVDRRCDTPELESPSLLVPTDLCRHASRVSQSESPSPRSMHDCFRHNVRSSDGSARFLDKLSEEVGLQQRRESTTSEADEVTILATPRPSKLELPSPHSASYLDCDVDDDLDLGHLLTSPPPSDLLFMGGLGLDSPPSYCCDLATTTWL